MNDLKAEDLDIFLLSKYSGKTAEEVKAQIAYFAKMTRNIPLLDVRIGKLADTINDCNQKVLEAQKRAKSFDDISGESERQKKEYEYYQSVLPQLRTEHTRLEGSIKRKKKCLTEIDTMSKQMLRSIQDM